MKITKIDTLFCDAGWRPWIFIKIQTDEGITGYSECTDSNGSPLGIAGVVRTLEPLLIGKDPRSVEKLFWEMFSVTRQSPGSIIQKAMGGIENALLDIKAKALGIPVYELFGGPIRDKFRVYWSHCGTTRARAWKVTNTAPLNSLGLLKKFGEEIIEKGFNAVKTNIVMFDSNEQYVYMPGFGKTYGGPELNLPNNVKKGIVKYIEAFRKAIGDDIDLILDLNFNFKQEGYIQISRLLEPYNLLWLEIDSYDPDSLLQIKQASRIPICSGENLYTSRQYRPYFEKHSMDVASIDIIWNGFLQSKKIADMAEIYELNVCPHNYYSHFATYISAHFCAVIPNFKIMEVDIDDVPWKDALVTKQPKIENGILYLDNSPGWGVDLNEEVINEHPWPKK